MVQWLKKKSNFVFQLLCINIKHNFFGYLKITQPCSSRDAGGVLAYELTLFGPRGADYARNITTAPPHLFGRCGVSVKYIWNRNLTVPSIPYKRRPDFLLHMLFFLEVKIIMNLQLDYFGQLFQQLFTIFSTDNLLQISNVISSYFISKAKTH